MVFARMFILRALTDVSICQISLASSEHLKCLLWGSCVCPIVHTAPPKQLQVELFKIEARGKDVSNS